MDINQFKFDGRKNFNPANFDTSATPSVRDKKEGIQLLAKNIAKIDELQGALYADNRQGLLVLFQAMDAAGKDGTIKHVFSGLNPAGIKVTNFKQPSTEEVDHDYLWRIHQAAPERGTIGIFNRSHYEEVLIARVLNLPKSEALPARALKEIWKNRYTQIRDFEEYLYQNGITILKFYLNISKSEQKQRFLDRINDPTKNWKFNIGDLDTRNHWEDYMRAYREAINNTATPTAPWFVVPADKKWYARLYVSEVILQTLKDMRLQYPRLNKTQLEELDKAQILLGGTNEKTKPAPKEQPKKLESPPPAENPVSPVEAAAKPAAKTAPIPKNPAPKTSVKKPETPKALPKPIPPTEKPDE